MAMELLDAGRDCPSGAEEGQSPCLCAATGSETALCMLGKGIYPFTFSPIQAATEGPSWDRKEPPSVQHRHLVLVQPCSTPCLSCDHFPGWQLNGLTHPIAEYVAASPSSPPDSR